jgi:hypothetical protein
MKPSIQTKDVEREKRITGLFNYAADCRKPPDIIGE